MFEEHDYGGDMALEAWETEENTWDYDGDEALAEFESDCDPTIRQYDGEEGN
jgi:hypothetical protein